MNWLLRIFGGIGSDELLNSTRDMAKALEIIDQYRVMCAELREERRGAVDALLGIYRCDSITEVRRMAFHGLRKAGVKVE